METQLVKAPVVAQKLGVAASTIFRMARMGKIPSYAVGPKQRGLRFAVDEVRQALRRPTPVEPAKKAAAELVGA